MTSSKLETFLKSAKPEDWKVLLASFSASYGLGLVAIMGLPFMFGATLRDLGWTEFQAGLLCSIEFIAITLASVVLAPYMNRVPRRTVALLGLAIATLGNLLSILAPDLSYSTAIFYRSIVGIGCGIALASGNATVANAKNPERLAGEMSTLFVMLMAGTMLLFPWASETYGYRGVYGVLAGVSLVLGPCLLALPQTLSDEAKEKVAKQAGGVLLRLPSLLALAAIMIFAVRDMSPWMFVEVIGTDVGLTSAEVGKVLSLQAVVGIVGPLVAALVGSRFGLSIPLAIGILASGAVYVLMLFFHDSQTVYVATALFIGMTYFVALTYLTALAAELDPAGRVVAAAGGALSAGVAIGPMFGGYLVGVIGFKGTSLVLLGMVIATLVLALSAARSVAGRTTH